MSIFNVLILRKTFLKIICEKNPWDDRPLNSFVMLQVKKRNLIYSEVIKRGLPRRYDRLHDNLELMADVFDNLIFFDYFFDIIALLVCFYCIQGRHEKSNK